MFNKTKTQNKGRIITFIIQIGHVVKITVENPFQAVIPYGTAGDSGAVNLESSYVVQKGCNFSNSLLSDKIRTA